MAGQNSTRVRFRRFVRFAGFVAVSLACTLGAITATVAVLGAPGPRRRAGMAFCHLWARASCRILRIRRRVIGAPPSGPVIVAANHVSYVDILVLGSLYPSVFVAKREIADWPVFGWMAKRAGTLFVDRERARDVVRVGKAMTVLLDRGLPITLFPEGTASDGKRILPFLPSLFEPAASRRTPCWGAVVSYATGDPDRPPSTAVAWGDGRALVPHAKGVLALDRIDAVVRFAPSPVVSGDRKILARELEAWAREGFIPLE